MSGKRDAGSEAPRPVVTLDELAGGLRTVYVPDAFGPGRGVFVRGYTQEQFERWMWAARGRGRGELDKGRLEAVQLCECLVTGGASDSPRLFCGDRDPSEDDLALVRRCVLPGHWARLVGLADELAGFEGPILERLEAAGVPFTGDSTGSGASTASAAPPASSGDGSGSTSPPTPTTAS